MVQVLLRRDSGMGTAGGAGGRHSFIVSIITSREGEGVTFYISTSCSMVTVRDWNVVLSIKGL